MQSIKIRFRSIAQVIDFSKIVGAVWFALIGTASCLFVFLSYRAGGSAWDSVFGKYGEFREMATGLVLVFVIYLNRYFFFPAHLQVKTRQPAALRIFFIFFVVFIAVVLTFVYPRLEGYNPAAYGWYGLYLLAILGIMLSYACEICWALFRYRKKIVGEICRRKMDGVGIKELLPQCSKLRKEINSDSIRIMYGIITVAAFVLFVSWTTYFRYAKILHILFFCLLVITCIYPFLKLRWTVNSIKNKEINVLGELIDNLDAEMLARQKTGESVNELEEHRMSLERSRERLEKKESFTRVENHISVAVSVFGIVGQVLAWTGTDKAVQNFIGNIIGKII